MSEQNSNNRIFKKYGVNIYYFFRDLFFTSLCLLLFLLIIEDLQPGFVSFWLEMKYVLGIVLVTGILAFLAARENGRRE
jgi:hypothetical protein